MDGARRIFTRLFTWAGRLGVLLVALGLLYGLAGIVGSLWPAHPRADPPPDAITIYISDNGIHTGLILPARHELADWSDLVRPRDLRDPALASDHLLFGWGDRAFYLETPTWGDVRPSTALNALWGSDSALIHVDHVVAPTPGDSIRPIVVSRAQFRAIAAAIREDFIVDLQGRPTPVPGYGATDVFYEAWGRYSAISTCNEWTGGILRDAGVRVGKWTPFSFGLMWWFPGEGES